VRRAALLVAAALLCAAAVLPPRSEAADLPTVTVTLSPSTLSAGQDAILQIEIGGAFRISSAPVLPLTNLTVIAGPSLENRFEWINGRSSSRTELVYRVRAGKPGRAAVGSIRLVDASGLTVTTVPIAADVGVGLAGEEPAAPETGGDPLLVSRLDPPAPLVGQQAVWTLYLVTRGQAERGEVEALPDFRGFWAEDLEREGNVQPQVWNLHGTLYRAYPMVRKALFATRPGRLSIGSARARVSVRESVFDVFDSPFSESSAVEKESAPLAVSPRPSPSPELPVGRFALKLSLDRPRVAAGQAVAVTAQLSGDGRLADATPPLLAVAGARVSEPESRLSIRRSTSRISSTRTWEWVVTPGREGALEVPAVSIPTVDPASARVVPVSSGALRLQVDPPPPAATAAVPAPAALPARPAFPPAAAAAAAIGAAAILLLGFWIGRRRATAGFAPAADVPDGEEDLDRVLAGLETEAQRRGREAAARVAEWRRRWDEVRFAPHFSSRDEASAALEKEIRQAARAIGKK